MKTDVMAIAKVNTLMCMGKETFTFKRSERCIFKGGGIRIYAFNKQYTLEDCLDEYCLIKGWEWITLVKTSVKGGSEWGYFTYKVACPDVSAWGLD